MKRSNIAASAKLYGMIINKLARRGELEGAKEWVDKMREAGLKVDDIVYNVMVDAAMKQVLTEIKERKRKKDIKRKKMKGKERIMQKSRWTKWESGFQFKILCSQIFINSNFQNFKFPKL